MVSTEELRELIEHKKDFLLIDVREEQELKHGMISAAKHLPLSEFKEALDMGKESFQKRYGFFLDKNKRIILYCRSGARSGRAAEYMKSLGYKAENYPGSILEWSKFDKNINLY
jgi:rhodanese-related sulfurtransferase